MRITTLLSVLVTTLFITAGAAHAAPWDSKGWVKLGEREVNGKFDHDVIAVGRYEGKFSKLTLVVEKSEIELLQFEVEFGNGDKWDPKVSHYFRENTRTRVIDLPGDDRVIKKINLKYKNLPGGGRAKVEVWAWKTESAKPVPFKWDSKGWTKLGERSVNGKFDHDRITVGSYKGKFEKVQLIVTDSDLDLIDLEIKFGKGAPWHPELKYHFKEGDRSRVIDFPGDERVIKFIDFKYKNTPGGGAAKMQVWAK